MSSNPFTLEGKNAFNEVSYDIVPSPFGMANLTAMQTKQHSVCDAVSTSIISTPQLSYNCQQPQIPMGFPNNNNNYNPLQNPQVIYAHKCSIPGGVRFTFKPPHQKISNNIFQGCHIPTIYPNLPQDIIRQQELAQKEIALKQAEKEAIEFMVLQEQLKKKSLRFHFNGQTSTTDLSKGPSQVPISKGTPDFNNLMAVLNDLKKELKEMGTVDFTPSALYSETSTTAKKLVLTKSPDLKEIRQNRVKGNIINRITGVDQDTKNNPNAHNKRSEKQVQTKRLCVKAFEKKATKSKRKKQKRKPSRQKRTPSKSSSSTCSCSCSCSSSSESIDDENDND